MSKPLFWIVGPSAAGKTTTIEALRNFGFEATLDLDVVGGRTDPFNWREWIIPPQIFPFLRDYRVNPDSGFVTAGVSSYPLEMLTSAVQAGFQPLVLIPAPDVVVSNRRARGDSSAKIRTAAHDVKSWLARKEFADYPQFSTTDELIVYLRAQLTI